MTVNAASPTVHHAPSFAGGRLEFLNQLLWCHVLARRQGAKPRLILDANLLQDKDLELSVQNANGDVVTLQVPDHGRLGHGSRVALRRHLQDLLPATAGLEAALEAFLPAPGHTLLQAAAIYWQQLFPELELVLVDHGQPLPADAMTMTAAPPAILWLSQRLIQSMEHLACTPAQLLRGEAYCRSTLERIPIGELEVAFRALEEAHEQLLPPLKKIASELDASLLGAWLRLKRDLQAAASAFANSADRAGRNRQGTRGAQLHALAQLAAPHEQSQGEGLSLLSLAMSHQWQASRVEGYITSLMDCKEGFCLLKTD